MIFLALLLVVAGCGEEQSTVLSVHSRAVIAGISNGKHSYGFAFRQFVASKDLGGIYQLLAHEKSQVDDRQEIRQLLVGDDDPELTDNAHSLMRKIIRHSGHGQVGYMAKHFIGGELNEALSSLKDKLFAFYLASHVLGENGSNVDEKLNKELAEAIGDYQQAWQQFSYVYLSVTQGSRKVGSSIRQYFENSAKNLASFLRNQPQQTVAKEILVDAIDHPELPKSLALLEKLARNCRQHGFRTDEFIELTHRVEVLVNNVRISNIWPVR